MKKTALVLIVLGLLGSGIARGDDGDIPENLFSFRFPEFLIHILPGASYYPTFFENYAPDATFLIEESNGFSLVDSPRVYYEGDSFVQFNWYYDGFKINSAIDDGAPGVRLPFSAASRYVLRGESPLARDYGFESYSPTGERSFSRARASAAMSGLGDYIPWANFLVNPHASNHERDDRLYSTRRRIVSNYDIDYVSYRKSEKSSLLFALTSLDMQRRFNDFNALDRTFDDSGRLTLVSTKYEAPFKDGSLDIVAVYNDLSRNHFLAELGRLPQETQRQTRQSYFAGIQFRRKNLALGLSYLREREHLTANLPNFLKDLEDKDGDGLFPFEKMGSFSSHVLRLDIDYHVFPPERTPRFSLDLYGTAKAAFLKGTENAFDFSPLSFSGRPELVVLWDRGQAYDNANLNFEAGALLRCRLLENVSLLAKVLVRESAARFASSANNLQFFAPGFDIGLQLFKKPAILLSYEEMPYELRENVNLFLERDRPGGTIRRWADANGDGIYQPGEEGSVVGYTGGPFHSTAAGLKIPLKKRILISLTTPLSKNFDFSLKGLVKKIERNLWVQFKEDYGFYETVAGTSYYFFDSPYRDYVLTNDPFSKKPFYAQILFQVTSREGLPWVFSFSFLAHIGMGRTAFGNGPAANDIGILSESEANPNALINGYGRVDGDRAFMSKIFFGYVMAKNLTLGVDIKYRDGTPFAFLDSFTLHDQRVTVYRTIRGENEAGRKGGPRRDYLTDVSFKLQVDFRIFRWDVRADLTVFNALDFGSELSEDIYSGGDRLANELQLPRGVRLGLTVLF
jgi:hypothetical protein